MRIPMTAPIILRYFVADWALNFLIHIAQNSFGEENEVRTMRAVIFTQSLRTVPIEQISD